MFLLLKVSWEYTGGVLHCHSELFHLCSRRRSQADSLTECPVLAERWAHGRAPEGELTPE